MGLTLKDVILRQYAIIFLKEWRDLKINLVISVKHDIWIISDDDLITILSVFSNRYTGYKTIEAILYLHQSWFLWWDIAPFLGHGLHNPPWISLGLLADLLGHINTLFHRSQLWHQLGHMGASSLRNEVTHLIWDVGDNSLCLLVTLFWTWDKSTASRTTQSLGHLLTLGHGVGLGPELLGDGAHLPGPLAALLISHISTLGQLTFLLVLCPAVGDIVHHSVGIVPGPTLADILSPTHLRTSQVTILNSDGIINKSVETQMWINIVSQIGQFFVSRKSSGKIFEFKMKLLRFRQDPSRCARSFLVYDQ